MLINNEHTDIETKVKKKMKPLKNFFLGNERAISWSLK